MIEANDKESIELAENQQNTIQTTSAEYDEESIKTLDPIEHIRRRPGMYIGALGNGNHSDDGIYVLIKEVIDNSIDEFNMKAGKRIDVTITEEGEVSVRDYGRGIPLGKVVDVVSLINTGAKFDSKSFQKSVGLNGVGLKAVNALSTRFEVSSYRNGKMASAVFEKGKIRERITEADTAEATGTFVKFLPDNTLFRDFKFKEEFLDTMFNNFSYLNSGLQLRVNGKRYFSRNGLLDLLRDNLTADPLYPIIHLKGENIEAVLTHTNQYGEEYYSFVNGANTVQGGTHLRAFKEAVGAAIKDFSGKGYEFSDIRNGMVAAISIRIEEPTFVSQTKNSLTSTEIAPGSTVTIKKFIGDFIKKELDDYLHRHSDVAEIMLRKIAQSEKERKSMAGVAKLARERAKKVNLHNKKLRDCSVHLNDMRKTSQKDDDRRESSSIFITEGDSASGTITKARNAETQAVFSLRGKPLNSYGLTQEIVYKNEEFNLLQAALNIEDGLDGLRYNKVIIATDADVDGMHIRLLIITFFLMFFPDLVKKGHVYILQTPLFRVRDKRSTRRSRPSSSGKGKGAKSAASQDVFYCYTDEERQQAIERLGVNAEITRFKGLGEINEDEFREFIGPQMRLDPVSLKQGDDVARLLEFYMGKNTPQRQNFIIDNLVIEDDSEI